MEKRWSLDKLLQYISIEKIKKADRQEIQGIAYDSRQVRDNYLFVAIPGLKNNGANFIEEAIKRGAKAIVTQEDLLGRFEHKGISYIRVRDAREALSGLSAAFYDFPSSQLKVIGITGTNGKTSTAYFLESILKTAHLSVGLIGTINYRIGERTIPSVYTTPESLELQSLLREMVNSGISHVIMEVSSHALAQKRVSQIEFDIAVFTNLSQDHLDYHKTMQSYLSSKSLLFEYLGRFPEKDRKKVGVVNGDEPLIPEILKILKRFPEVETLSFGLGKKNIFQAKVVDSILPQNRFIIENDLEYIDVNLSLPGRHNVYNALAAAACGIRLGIDSKLVKEGLEKMKNIPGRFEFIGETLPFKIVVDYAHTEEALRNILETARSFHPRRIILIFGCGGDRDKLKRPQMGKVAERLTDFSILTSDNPRSEEPEKIIADIERGFGFKGNYQIILDRYQAIKSALKMAEPDDMIIVAGKGHETYQVYKDTVSPFDDREVVKKALREIGISG